MSHVRVTAVSFKMLPEQIKDTWGMRIHATPEKKEILSDKGQKEHARYLFII